MGILILIIEIVIVIFLARRLGTEAHDKGYSSILFIILACLLWLGSRIIGNFIGILILPNRLMSLLMGWLTAILSYGLFYYFLAKIKDKEIFNENEAEWKKRNTASNTTQIPGENNSHEPGQ
jgi:hypothetical protein